MKYRPEIDGLRAVAVISVIINHLNNDFLPSGYLGVEEQFYVLFPFIVWLTGFGRQRRKGSGNLFLVIGFLALGSLIVRLSIRHNPAAFFLMPTRFWELSAGCLTFIAFNGALHFVL